MVKLSGPNATSHDYAEGEGSFEGTLARLGEGMRTVVTRSNMRVLAQIGALGRRHGATRWQLVCLGLEGDPDARCPRLAMAIPRVLHATAQAEKAGMQVELVGFPLCLLGPFRRLADAEPRHHPDRCSPCVHKPKCPGIDEAYAARYGAAELSPTG